MSPLPNIGLAIELSSEHARGLVRGVSRYAQSNGPWQLRLIERLRHADIRRDLAACHCDGLIVRVETPTIVSAFSSDGLHIVNVGSANTPASWPRIDTDNAAVCGLTVSHLLDRGYRRFAFCGMTPCRWSQGRYEHFRDELRRRSLDCDSLAISFRRHGATITAHDGRMLRRWIAQLPKPVGIMACNDHCGRAVLDACRDVGTPVPDEVGVIGVNNDEFICELCSPPLSSVEANCELIGYAAAEMLDAMLHGRPPRTQEMLIKPTTVVGRRSTDATAVRDPIIAEAIRFVRAYGHTNICSSDVARHVHVSRRYLELQFRRSVGRTLHAEIQRIRLETAQRFLGETDWSLQVVAERSGFKQASHMSDLFQRRLQIRPGEYRRRIQNCAATP